MIGSAKELGRTQGATRFEPMRSAQVATAKASDEEESGGGVGAAVDTGRFIAAARREKLDGV